MTPSVQSSWWRRRRVVIAAAAAAVVALVAALLGPWSGIFVRVSLPCRHDDLHVLGYARGGPAPTTAEGLRFALPQRSAHEWFMAAVGHGLPPAVAEPGAVLWGEVRNQALGAPLPVQVVSGPDGSVPRVDLALGVGRVNAWLLQAARRDGSPWVARLDAGSRITDTAMGAPAGWDLRLGVVLSGLAARRDGQPGLVRLEAFAGVIDLRWSPGAHDTRVEAQVRLDRLRLSDQRGGLAGDVPAGVLDLVAQAVNAGLRAQPPVLPLVVPRETRLSVEVVAAAASASPAF